MVARRNFLKALIASGGLCASTRGGELFTGASPAESSPHQTGRAAIDRRALVGRHSPTSRKFEPLAPLSVGNGEFAFTADLTGLQTFPSEYESAMPLCTMSQWGWHTTPLPRGLDPSALRLTEYDTYGRKVGYHTSAEGQSELFKWLRENPHRLHLGRVGLQLTRSDGGEAQASDIREAEQRLDLWSGTLTSRFEFEGERVEVRTAVHPDFDLLAVSIESRLIAQRRLAVRFAFPYGSPEMKAADWNQPARHTTQVVTRSAKIVRLRRRLDADEYFVNVHSSERTTFADAGEHEFRLTLAGEGTRLEFIAEFSPSSLNMFLPTAASTFDASAAYWRGFWTQTAAVELAGSRDSRAEELERRVVLSQYLTAIQCAGSAPPQETGLTVNSWYGKFHLEMHWWHAAHFALWNRVPLFERSLRWYDSILPAARELARSQGYAGARWPKMVGPEGRDSPSPVGPLLVWQQPHPLAYAELCYLSNPTRATLKRYRNIVFETAEFMASFAHLDGARGRYVLGPPLIPAQENHPARETWNPTFELAYWSHSLEIAQRWRERLGLRREPKWDDVLKRLSALPVREGVYLAHENCPQTFTERNYDHPSMLCALGVLPGAGVDRPTMRRTLERVMREWRWEETWGWDYPATAMTAARLCEPRLAVDALLLKTEKNRYLPNGHNWQRPNLPCYLPGNGGLLYAVALMAGGWRGAPHTHAPGFPSDGSWTVRHEGLAASVLREI